MPVTPDSIVQAVMTGLATHSFEGISAGEFWPFVSQQAAQLEAIMPSMQMTPENAPMLDDFTKKVVWAWLLQEDDFLVLSVDKDASQTATKKKKEEIKVIVDKNELPDYQEFFEEGTATGYTLKVSDDFQSIYLAGVPQKDNFIPRFPYQLLIVIARHKERGINSVDLIKESGQDNRSLTKRLAVLEENLLVKKIAICMNRNNTNHMTHFRFVKKNNMGAEGNTADEVHENYYDRHKAMTDIIKELKMANNQLRITRDLYLDIKKMQPSLRLRWFNKILQFLVQHGLVELIQVQHPEVKRFYPAVRFVKDLPAADKVTELVNILKEADSREGFDSQNANGVDDDDEEEGADEDTDAAVGIPASASTTTPSTDVFQGRIRPSKQAHLNRYFSLPHQIRDLIERNPGLMMSDINSTLTGTYHLRQVSNILENYSSSTPVPDQPQTISGQMVHSGKMKYFRYTMQDHLNKKHPDYDSTTTIEHELQKPLRSKKSLFEESHAYGSKNSNRRRVRCASLWDEKDKTNKYFLVARGYSGPAGMAAASGIQITSTLQGSFQSSNGWIKVDAKKGKLTKIQKKVSEYQKEHIERSKLLEEYNAALDAEMNNLMASLGDDDLISSAALIDDSQTANLFMQSQFLTDGDTGHEFEDGIIPNLDIDITQQESDQALAHSQGGRNEQETASSVSAAPLDYGPGFRREKLLEIVDARRSICVNNVFIHDFSKQLNVGYSIARRTLIADSLVLEKNGLLKCEKFEGGKFVVKSIKNPPTEEEVEQSMVDNVRAFRPRILVDSVEVEELTVVNDGSLTKGRKFASREDRIKHVMDRLKSKHERDESVPPLPAKTRRRRRTRRTKAVESDECDDDDDDDDEGEGAADSSMVNDDNMVNAYGDDDDDEDLNSEDDEEDEGEEEDLLEPLMDDRVRKKLKPNYKQQARVAKVFKKVRASIEISNSELIILIKAIIVTQSLSSGGNVDWPKVCKVVDDKYNPDMLRRLWPRHKKMLGPKNVISAKRNFEKALMASIREGVIKAEDLDDYDVFKMLDIWKSSGAEIFLEKAEYEIAKEYSDNFEDFTFKPTKVETGVEVFKEPPSMIEREQLWTTRNFMCSSTDSDVKKVLHEADAPTPLQIAKTKLKALFATGTEKFDSARVKELFEGIPKELYASALTELEDVRAIAFLGEDSKIKFTLTDKLIVSLECKLDDAFVDAAKRMEEVISDVDNMNGAVMLSTRCPNGAYAPLMTMFANNAVSITRVDQKLDERDTYYTKALDRGKFESDFLISHLRKDGISEAKSIPPPIGAPCSYLWVDLVGDFNGALWRKCVYVVLWGVVVHPGTPIEVLCAKMNPLLEPFEVQAILKWLLARGNVKTSECGGFWPTSCWYDVK
jgi:transcription factor C subunit 3